MADPTTSCPNCGDYLLEETAQCLKCGYDVRAGEVRPIERNVLPSEGDTAEVTCRDCGAAVREHLVRCWNCGTFMRADIADSYEKMRERAPVVEFRPLPDWNPDNEVEDTPEQKAAEKASRITDARQAEAEPEPREAVPQAANEPEAETYSLSGATADEDDEFEMGVEFDLDVDEGGDDFDFDGALDDEFESVGDFDETTEPTVASSEPEAPPVRRGDTSAPPVRRGATDEPPVRRTEAAAEPPADQVAADSLLEIAIQEEKEVARRQRKNEKARRKRASARRNRRKAGPAGKKKAKRKAGPAAGRYRFWIKDVPLHVVPDPAKVKAKPGVLGKPTQTVDLGFGEVGLLVTSYVPQKSSLFGKAPNTVEMRKGVVEHLRKDGGLDDLPAGGHWSIEPEVARELPFEQPNEYAHETAFGGIPVFGDGRIALRLPDDSDSAETTEKRFLVFTLTEFRRFSKAAGAYGAKEFGAERGIPLVDATEKLSCHYTDQEFESLVDSSYHVHDPAIEMQVVGRRCQNCELVVCEDGRKKESIGGKSGKTIGKAKCPKCSEKFGEITLYAVKAGRPKSPKPVPS